MVDAGAVGLSARLSSAVPSLSLLSPHCPCCPQLYENFVEEIDAIDNGIAPAAGEPRYALSTTLSARVGHLNPRWNDPDQDTEVRTAPAAPGDTPLRDTTDPQCPQAGFRRAMELVGSEFLERLDFYYRAWLPARVLVEEAVRRRFEVTPSQPRGNLEFWGKLGCGEAKSPAFAPHTLCGPCVPAGGDSELLGMLSPGRFWESPPRVLSVSSPRRWTPAGRSWSCPRAAVPGRSTSSSWSRRWRCPGRSSSCCSRTGAGSGGCRASP